MIRFQTGTRDSRVVWKNFILPAKDFSLVSDFRELVARHLGVDRDLIEGVEIIKKSLDARKKSRIVYNLQLGIEAKDQDALLRNFDVLEVRKTKPAESPVAGLEYQGLSSRHKPIIIGSGPAGIFAALCLEDIGISSRIIERGEEVGKRIKTVNKLRSRGGFNPESNFCFGEGGAGTFSDGKLTCGRNHPLVRYIFEKFIEYGGPDSIRYEAHPHIGTDFLLRIAKKMRDSLVSRGSEFHFNTAFKSFKDGGKKARYEVELSNGEKLLTDHLILAIGHSARDTYRYLYEKKLAIAPKPFAMGARIEHPQEVIDEIQYGQCSFLPAAEYKLTARAGERGIWTFCMCPGGHLLPTGAQENHLAINGMSYHARNSGFANAAVVVNVLREDFYKGHPLDGMNFQAELERKAFKFGGENYSAPAQRLNDFLAKRRSRGELKSTYKPGVVSARMDQVFPGFIGESLRSALTAYNQKMRGYLSDEALIVGLESKTSAPITILRDKNLQSISHPGLFPCGEGAGFAGGIVSAALDGLKVGKAVADDLRSSVSLRALANSVR